MERLEMRGQRADEGKKLQWYFWYWLHLRSLASSMSSGTVVTHCENLPYKSKWVIHYNQAHFTLGVKANVPSTQINHTSPNGSYIRIRPTLH